MPQIEQISKIVSTISRESDQQKKHLEEMTGTIGRASTTGDANTQSVEGVSNVITSINRTIQRLDTIAKSFKSPPEDKVRVEGKTHPGFIPLLGYFAFRNRQSG